MKPLQTTSTSLAHTALANQNRVAVLLTLSPFSLRLLFAHWILIKLGIDNPLL